MHIKIDNTIPFVHFPFTKDHDIYKLLLVSSNSFNQKN